MGTEAPTSATSTATPTASPLQKLGLFVLLGVTLLLLVLTMQGGLQAAWSDANSLRARSVVNALRDGEPIFTAALWERTRAELEGVAQNAPGNAQLHDDLGFLYAARAQGVTDSLDPALAAQRTTLLRAAAKHYRTATELRPTFPYTWAYLALMLHKLDTHDAEFWHAFDAGVRYGQNEAGVQPALVRMAAELWPQLSTPRRQAVVAMVLQGKEGPRRTLVATIEKAQRTDDVLALVADRNAKAQWLVDRGMVLGARAQAMGLLPTGSPEANAQAQLWQQALADYAAALTVLPQFMAAQAGIVLAKHGLKEGDETLQRALIQVLHNPDVSREVILEVVRIAFIRWGELPPEIQQSTISLLDGAKPNVRRVLVRLARREYPEIPLPTALNN